MRVLSRYVVELTFETGEVRVIDLEPLLEGPVFERASRRHRPHIANMAVRWTIDNGSRRGVSVHRV